MHIPFKTMTALLLAGLVLIVATPAVAADTDALLNVLKQVDDAACKTPEKIKDHYHKSIVIISDDRRVMPDSRIKDYQTMLSDLRGIKCSAERKILNSNVGANSAFMMVDEVTSVTSDSGHRNDRQHSVCTYGFGKEGNSWKVALEHCTGLPDYTIDPGDDALYYFHNPVY